MLIRRNLLDFETKTISMLIFFGGSSIGFKIVEEREREREANETSHLQSENGSISI